MEYVGCLTLCTLAGPYYYWPCAYLCLCGYCEGGIREWICVEGGGRSLMNILPILVLVALWPMTFVVRRSRRTRWFAACAAGLSLFFLVTAFRMPEQWAMHMVFALLGAVLCVRGLMGESEAPLP